MVERLSRILNDSGLPPALLEIEITEASLASAIASESRVIDNIKSLGVSISIDDFGSGMSSLSYLKQFPVDVLKLDPGLISNLPRDQEDAVIGGEPERDRPSDERRPRGQRLAPRRHMR